MFLVCYVMVIQKRKMHSQTFLEETVKDYRMHCIFSCMAPLRSLTRIAATKANSFACPRLQPQQADRGTCGPACSEVYRLMMKNYEEVEVHVT